MANATDKHVDSNLGAPAEKADQAPGVAPELMHDWHQAKGKTELTTGEEVKGEDGEVVERAIDAARNSSQRQDAIERAIHPDSNRDGN